MTEFSRTLPADRIGAAVLDRRVEADPSELEAVARRLMIPAVSRLACSFRLRRALGGTIEAEGQLEAEVTQLCVITLEPFAHPVTEAFTVHFVPAGSETDDADPETPDEIPYRGDVIDLGEAATEQLALALDPYPKAPGATLDLDDEAPNGPFAALAGLRRTQ